jgi:hypothetical protein
MDRVPDTTVGQQQGKCVADSCLGLSTTSFSFRSSFFPQQDGFDESDSVYSGYPYFLTQFGTHIKSYGGLQYGADLRWNTPVKGLLIGASRMNEDIKGTGSATNQGTVLLPYSESSKA